MQLKVDLAMQWKVDLTVVLVISEGTDTVLSAQ